MSQTTYTGYNAPFPVGVKLPEIKIEKRYHDEVACSDLGDNFQFLRKLCFKRLKERGIDKLENAQVYYDRLKEELSTFKELGFVDYILLNWDILNYCKENDIPTGAGRGSAAGSLVLYVIGVTNIDPIEYDLFFERFVSKSRARKIEHEGETYLDGSLLADVDNDISYDRRAEVINYIEKKNIIITISNNGYIKRSLLENYRAQNRGGKGKTGMSTREEDFVKEIHLTDTHTKLLVFSSFGKVYALKSFDIPEASLKARGKPIINLLPFAQDEKIATFLPLPLNEAELRSNLVIFVTKNGMIRKNKLIDIAKSGKRELRETGKLSIKLKPKDELISVKIANDDQDILLSSSDGKCLRFPIKKLRLFTGLNSGGVRGIKLEKNNYIISQSVLKHSFIDMSIRQEYLKYASENRKNNKNNIRDDFIELQKNEEFLLAITTKGFGKRSSAYEYRISNRGGKGITGILTTPKNGKVNDCFVINEYDQIIMVSDKGQIIRVNISQIRIAGRTTQGVSIFKIPEGDKIVYVSRVGNLESN